MGGGDVRGSVVRWCGMAKRWWQPRQKNAAGARCRRGMDRGAAAETLGSRRMREVEMRPKTENVLPRWSTDERGNGSSWIEEGG